jgi:hypothetical protein
VWKEVILGIYNTITKPALQHGSEMWVLKAEDERRTDASEMRFLQPPLAVSPRDRYEELT